MHLVENCIMILLPFISHLLMVIPFWVTGGSFRNSPNPPFFAAKNANLAQKALKDPEKDGKIFDEETFAVERLASISWVLPFAIVVSSLLDLFLVIAFQKWLRPWRRIIAKSNKVEEIGESQ